MSQTLHELVNELIHPDSDLSKSEVTASVSSTEDAEAASYHLLASMWRDQQGKESVPSSPPARIKAIQGFDPNLRYVIYVEAQGQDMLDLDYNLKQLKLGLDRMGVQCVLVPLTGKPRDIKLRAIEVETLPTKSNDA